MGDVRQGVGSADLPNTTSTQQQGSESGVSDPLIGIAGGRSGSASRNVSRRRRKPTPLPTKGDLLGLPLGERRVFIDTVIEVLAETMLAEQAPKGAA